MPIYEGRCRTHGRFEVYVRDYRPLDEVLCRECHSPAERVMSAPALIKVQRGWNEKANECQRDPHTQAKAQLTNVYRGQAERTGAIPKVPTEEQIQVGAREIAKQGTREDVETHHARSLLAEKRRKKAEQ